MKIETKFQIGNFVKHKFDTATKLGITIAEVIYVNSETCSGGTQVFYTCRIIILQKEFKKQWQEDGDFKWIVGHAITKGEREVVYQKYREDELIEAPQEYIDIVLGNNK